MAEGNSRKPKVGDFLKSIQPVITSNGDPFLPNEFEEGGRGEERRIKPDDHEPWAAVKRYQRSGAPTSVQLPRPLPLM